MGDIKKQRKKYSRPSHPWNRARIEAERIIKNEYGLQAKSEIWKIDSKLKKYGNLAKRYTAASGEKAENDKQILLAKIYNLGLLDQNAKLEDILLLTTKDLMERRLQTIIFRKGLARTIKQARQMITHEHILVGSRKVTVPSYIVKRVEENKIGFAPDSTFMNPQHPERNIVKKEQPNTARKGRAMPEKGAGAVKVAKTENNVSAAKENSTA